MLLPLLALLASWPVLQASAGGLVVDAQPTPSVAETGSFLWGTAPAPPPAIGGETWSHEAMVTALFGIRQPVLMKDDRGAASTLSGVGASRALSLAANPTATAK